MKIEEYMAHGKKRYKYHGYLGLDPLTKKKVSITRQGFVKKSDAKNDFAKQKALFDSGQYNSKSKITFKELYELWKDIYRPTVRESTYITTISVYDKHVVPYFENFVVTEISTYICQKYATEYCLNYPTGEMHYRKAKRILTFAKEKMKIIAENPFDDVTVPDFDEIESNPDFLELDQVEDLLSVIDDNLWYAFFRLLVHSGMRKSEARALKWSDISFYDSTISITKTLSKAKGGEKVEDPKSKRGFRTIYIDSITLGCIKDLKQNTSSIYVFANPLNKKPYASNMPNYYLDQYSEKANLGKVTVHTLRHTHVTQCIDSGMNIVQVAARIGDTIDTVSKIYAHATNKRKIESIKKYEEYIKTSKKVNGKSMEGSERLENTAIELFVENY